MPGSEEGYYTLLMSCLAKDSAPKIEQTPQLKVCIRID